MSFYVPGTEEKDPKKVIMSLQQAHEKTATNTSDIATINSTLTNKVTGPSTATDNAAARFDGTTGKLVQDSALLIADTTGALSRSGNGGVPVQGSNTNDNAAAGDMGEYAVATRARASALSLTTNVAANVTSISLTAGDWDVVGQVGFKFGTTTAVSYMAGGTSSTSATLPSSSPQFQYPYAIPASSNDMVGPVPAFRYSLSSTTTIYLVAVSGFTTSTNEVYGYIQARRVR